MPLACVATLLAFHGTLPVLTTYSNISAISGVTDMLSFSSFIGGKLVPKAEKI